MCQHWVSPSPFPSSSSHIQHTLQNNYTYSHTNLTSFSTQIQIQIHITHVMWSAQEVHKSKTDHTNAIYLLIAEPKARNSAVGWH